MDKKVVIIICAVLAFFLGAIWVDNCPTFATLVCFLELAIGGIGGFLFKKDVDEKHLDEYVSAINRLTDANLRANEEIATLKSNMVVTEEKKATTSSKKKATKPKTE